MRTRAAWLRDAEWLNQRRLSTYPKFFLIAYALVIAVWATIGMRGLPFGCDYQMVWSASDLALKGKPAAVYDYSHLWAQEQTAVSKTYAHVIPWFYPPTYLLYILPLSMVPYFWSLSLWIGLTLGAYLLVIRKIAPYKGAIVLALAFPGVWINAVNGQNSFLSTALLGAGLLALCRRPALGGIFFGLLTYKPQLGVLLPIVLIATGEWRAIAVAAATALALAGASVALFGVNTWQAFIAHAWVPRKLILEQGGFAFWAQQSVFSAMRLWHFPVWASYVGQAMVAGCVIVAAVWIWRQAVSFRLKAAALVAGSVLVTPYVFDYDLALLALPIAWVAVEGLERGFLPFEKVTLAVAWLLPLLARPTARYTLIPLGPVVTALLFALIVRKTILSRCGRPSAGLNEEGALTFAASAEPGHARSGG